MEIIGKIAVKRNKKEIAKKTWLTIGLVAFALTMICEVLLGNFAFLALIVPCLYLLNLRNKMGKSILYKDVVIRIDRYDGENVVEILNCEYRDRVLYSARFSLQENSEIGGRTEANRNMGAATSSLSQGASPCALCQSADQRQNERLSCRY